MAYVHDTLSPALRLFVRHAVRDIESTKCADDVANILNQAVCLATGCSEADPHSDVNDLAFSTDRKDNEDASTSISSAYHFCARESASLPPWNVASAFYWTSFEQLADVLLSGVLRWFVHLTLDCDLHDSTMLLTHADCAT